MHTDASIFYSGFELNTAAVEYQAQHASGGYKINDRPRVCLVCPPALRHRGNWVRRHTEIDARMYYDCYRNPETCSGTC